MSISALAQNEPLAIADSLNYKQKLFSHSSYRFVSVTPNTYGNSVALGASQIQSTILLPTEVFNWYHSYLLYTVKIPAAGEGTFIWYAMQALKEISQIQFYVSDNVYMVDVSQLQNYLDVVLKKKCHKKTS
ncbi:MAG TPA: hypothetical protein PLS50_01640 [Candidatus Dojkabacteria bacterium]|nr:hypothetical protein [Candidatus Dojkabacteria bacterium]